MWRVAASERRSASPQRRAAHAHAGGRRRRSATPRERARRDGVAGSSSPRRPTSRSRWSCPPPPTPSSTSSPSSASTSRPSAARRSSAAPPVARPALAAAPRSAAGARRAPPASREQFGALYDELRGRGVREVDGVAQLLQRVGEGARRRGCSPDHATAAAAAAAGARSPRRAAAAPSSSTPSERSGVSASTSVAAFPPPPPPSVTSAAAAAPPPPSELSWLHAAVPGLTLHGGMIGGRAGRAPADRGSVRTASGALVALPVGEQERGSSRTCWVCSSAEGRFVYASTAQAELTAAARPHRRKADVVAGALPPVRFALRPLPSAGKDDFPKRRRPTRRSPRSPRSCCRWGAVPRARAVRARGSGRMAGGARSGALRRAARLLQEHLVSIAQLQRQQRKGLALQQLWYFLQPTARALAALHELVSPSRRRRADGAAGADRRRAAGRARRAAAAPSSGCCTSGARRSPVTTSLWRCTTICCARPPAFFEMLRGWVYRGECDDPYGEFLVREAPSVAKRGAHHRVRARIGERFTLAPAQVRRGRARHDSLPSLLPHSDPHSPRRRSLSSSSRSPQDLEAGKYLPHHPRVRAIAGTRWPAARPPLQYSTDTRELGAAIERHTVGGGRADEGVDSGRTADGTPRFRQALLPTRPGERTPSPRRLCRLPFARPLTPLPSFLLSLRATSSSTSSTRRGGARPRRSDRQGSTTVEARALATPGVGTLPPTASTTSTTTSTTTTSTTLHLHHPTTSHLPPPPLRQAAVADAVQGRFGLRPRPLPSNQLLG